MCADSCIHAPICSSERECTRACWCVHIYVCASLPKRGASACSRECDSALACVIVDVHVHVHACVRARISSCVCASAQACACVRARGRVLVCGGMLVHACGRAGACAIMWAPVCARVCACASAAHVSARVCPWCVRAPMCLPGVCAHTCVCMHAPMRVCAWVRWCMCACVPGYALVWFCICTLFMCCACARQVCTRACVLCVHVMETLLYQASVSAVPQRGCILV